MNTKVINMSKYKPLWDWIIANKDSDFKLSYAEIEEILDFSLDHSFLTYKKELNDYGFLVDKISMKDKTISFKKD